MGFSTPEDRHTFIQSPRSWTTSA